MAKNLSIKMTIQELKNLRETEDKVEFKEAKRNFEFAGGKHIDPSERRKCVLGYTVAFANEGGGMLVLGMKDQHPHEVVGTTFAENKIGNMEDEIFERLDIRVKIEELFEKGKRVLVFKIPSRPIGSTLKFEGVPLMRIGDSLRVMSDSEVFRILSEREPDFSVTICEGLTFDDLDPEAIAVMKERYAVKQENPTFKTLPDLQILSDLELIENGKLNHAALILLGSRKTIRKYLPNAAVTIEYRLHQSMIPYTARQEFQEALFKAIDKIWAYIDQPASNPQLHIRDKFYIYDIKSFDEEVIREAVINSCIHRSYSHTDDVFIKQYPDEIIITNSGGFPYGVSKENILTVNSHPRNKRLTEVLQKTGLIERSGQGVDKMFYLCLMQSKPLPDYSHTDSTQVELRIKAKIIDNAFYLFVNKIQSDRTDKLNVFDLLTLDKVRQGISTDMNELSVEKLQRESLIKSQSSADRKFVLGDLYYEISRQPAYIKDYRTIDLKTITKCFENEKEVSMMDFVEAFRNKLSREQVRYLVSKLEDNELIVRLGGGRSIKYQIGKNRDIEKTVFEYFNEKLSQ